MYSLTQYAAMFSSKPRMDPYIEALRRVVTPQSVVLDIGAGTGAFSFAAAELGARKVYALEPSSAIEVGRKIAAASGLGERVTFIQSLSNDLSLPELADVVVFDIAGVLPWLEGSVESVWDARNRLLRPGGVVVPAVDRVFACLVEAEEIYSKLVGPWTGELYGVGMDVGREFIVNSWLGTTVSPEAQLTPAGKIATIDYRTAKNAPLDAELSWKVDRNAVCHGLGAWFDRETCAGQGYSNAPGAPAEVHPAGIYNQALFPWREPVELVIGDTVKVRLRAHRVGNPYVWRWEIRVFDGNTGSERVKHEQSNLFGETMTLERLGKTEDSYVPATSRQSRVDQFLVSLIDGKRTLGEIVSEAFERFPEELSSRSQALARAGKLADALGK